MVIIVVSSLRRDHSEQYSDEPNLIPLLDFMLVLLIMFILLAGPVQKNLKLPLPEVDQSTASQENKNLIVLSIKNEKEIYVDEKRLISLTELEKYLSGLNLSSSQEITLNAEKHLPLDTLLRLFAITKKLGVKTANIQVES